jgi:predicted TIM-barrel fold metal-dependent hydrolase
MTLIDIHTHTQPDVQSGLAFIEPYRTHFGEHGQNGSVQELLLLMERLDIETTLIVPWLAAQDLVAARIAAGQAREEAVREVLGQWSELNGWATTMVTRHPGRIVTLVGLDPILMSDEQMENEVLLRLDQGAIGLKIAPLFLDATVQHPAVRRVWDLARRYGVFILSECGDTTMGHHHACGHPKYFDGVLSEYPDVDVLLAHLGIHAEAEVARLTHTYPNVYADLSMRVTKPGEPGYLPPADLVEKIRMTGVDRVLYGTNYPIVDARYSADAFGKLPLNEDERQKIGYLNARGLIERATNRKKRR